MSFKYEDKKIVLIKYLMDGNEYSAEVGVNCSEIIYDNNYCGDHSSPYFYIHNCKQTLKNVHIVYEQAVLNVMANTIDCPKE